MFCLDNNSIFLILHQYNDMILYKIVFVYVNISINYQLLCIYVDINYGQILSDYHYKKYAFLND